MDENKALLQLTEEVKANSRSLRGHNGEPGLVGGVAILSDHVSRLEVAFTKMEESLNQWKKVMDERLASLEASFILFKSDCEKYRDSEHRIQDLEDKSFMTKESLGSFLKDLIMPVVVALLTAFTIKLLG